VLLLLEVHEAAVDGIALAPVALVQLLVVDAHHLQLELPFRRVVVRRKLHVRQQQLGIVLVLDVEVFSKGDETR